MTLPLELDKTLPADSDNPSQGASSIRNLKTFLQDVFGLDDAVDYTAQAFDISTTGVVTVSQNGFLPSRLGTHLLFNGTSSYDIGEPTNAYSPRNIYASGNLVVAGGVIPAGGIVPLSYTYAGLPAAGSQGRLANVTDSDHGLWRDTGSLWLKEFPWVNVKDFGAKGDGVTDDTQAFLDAFLALAPYGGKIVVPRGVYVLNELDLERVGYYVMGITIEGAAAGNDWYLPTAFGTKLLAKAGADYAIDIGPSFRSTGTADANDNAPTAVISGCVGLKIKDLVVDGNASYNSSDPDTVLTDGMATISDATLTSSSANWVAGDIGKVIEVVGAGYGGQNLVTTIASINSTSSIEMSTQALTTASNTTVYYGTRLAANQTCDGVRATYNIHGIFEDVTFVNCRAGLSMRYTDRTNYVRCRWSHNKYGVYHGPDNRYFNVAEGVYRGGANSGITFVGCHHIMNDYNIYVESKSADFQCHISGGYWAYAKVNDFRLLSFSTLSLDGVNFEDPVLGCPSVSACTITGASATVTASGGAFPGAIAGQSIRLVGAGAAGVDLATTIASVGKTGAALTTSTAATTTYDATNVYDATAWTLTSAAVGKIVEASGGSYGVISAVLTNRLTVLSWVGGTPPNGQESKVYAAALTVTDAPSTSVTSGTVYYGTGKESIFKLGQTYASGVALVQALKITGCMFNATQTLAHNRARIISLVASGDAAHPSLRTVCFFGNTLRNGPSHPLCDATIVNQLWVGEVLGNWIGSSAYLPVPSLIWGHVQKQVYSEPLSITYGRFGPNGTAITEMRGGTSAAIASAGTIAHGLAGNPSMVMVGPTGAGPTDISWTHDATNITVTYTGAGPYAFNWLAWR